MHAVYVIQNDVTKEVYIGRTSNLKARIEAHNAGGKKATTRNEGAWHYVYLELFRSKDDAQEREEKLKAHGSAKQKLLLRLRKSLL
jgi:predicted GIY-YIG superfamily endonuclease